MKKIILYVLFICIISGNSFSQSFLIKWNETNITYELKQVNISNEIITDKGSSTVGFMSSYYDLNQIHFDNLNNQLVSLCNWNKVWVYNLNSNTDKLVSLDTLSCRALTLSDGACYLIWWNEPEIKYEIKQLNLSNGNITHIGKSSAGFMTNTYNLNEIHFDRDSNQLVSLCNWNKVWVYNLTRKTDKLIDLGSDPYRALTLSDNGCFLIKWNDTNVNYEINKLDISSGKVTHIGTSTAGYINSYYELKELNFDAENNQLISLCNSNKIWIYNLTSKIDKMVDLGTDTYRAITVNTATISSVKQYIDNNILNNEIEGIYNLSGQKINRLIKNEILIIKYTSGKNKKLYLN